MQLQYKPDFERSKLYWRAFWKKEMINRPCIMLYAPKRGVTQPEKNAYLEGAYDGDYLGALIKYDAYAAKTYFGGEAIPFADFSFGADQFSAFLGAEIEHPTHSEVAWVQPYITDLAAADLRLRDESGSIWRKMQAYFHVAKKFSEDRFLLSMPDLHSHFDSLCAVRGPEKTALDLIDQPDTIEKVMADLRAAYQPIIRRLYDLGDMDKRGCIGPIDTYSETLFATIQCDYITMISPRMARQFVYPAIEQEAAFLDHCVYHYDGPSALPHLDNILSIQEIDTIQWQPGAGQPPSYDWPEVLHRIQGSGKSIWEYDWPPAIVKERIKAYKPELLCLSVTCTTQDEAEDLLEWLEKEYR